MAKSHQTIITDDEDWEIAQCLKFIRPNYSYHRDSDEPCNKKETEKEEPRK